jgi:hypothetical protein
MEGLEMDRRKFMKASGLTALIAGGGKTAEVLASSVGPEAVPNELTVTWDDVPDHLKFGTNANLPDKYVERLIQMFKQNPEGLCYSEELSFGGPVVSVVSTDRLDFSGYSLTTWINQAFGKIRYKVVNPDWVTVDCSRFDQTDYDRFNQAIVSLKKRYNSFDPAIFSVKLRFSVNEGGMNQVLNLNSINLIPDFNRMVGLPYQVKMEEFEILSMSVTRDLREEIFA